MMEQNQIKLAIFDVAGTTVVDEGLVVEAFVDAIQDLEPDQEKISKHVSFVQETMGERKIDVFNRIFENSELAILAHERFIQSYLRRVKHGEISPVPGTETLFRKLKEKGIRVALNTGFPREILQAVIDTLQWKGIVDYSVASDEVSAGRPAPDLINALINQMNRRSSIEISGKNIIVFGDTMADMAAAKAAGAAIAVGVISGVHTRDQLLSRGADLVINYIYDSLIIFNEEGK